VGVIKIRYSDLPAGLHASTETEGRRTIIYLVPGLSAADRKNAIDRLRASARVGHGPKLPAIPLTLALITDSIRQNLRNGAAAARMHPTGAAIPVIALVCGAVLYALFVTGSIRIGPPSIADSAPDAALPSATAPAKAGDTLPDVTGGRGNGPAFSTGLTGDRRYPGASAGATGPAGRTTGTEPEPSSSGTPTPTPDGPATPPATPTSPSVPPNSPHPTPTPTHTHTGSGGGGTCLNLGILGVCLGL
jgi:hypothetical protein